MYEIYWPIVNEQLSTNRKSMKQGHMTNNTMINKTRNTGDIDEMTYQGSAKKKNM